MLDINLIASRRAQRQRTLALVRLAFYGLLGLGILVVLLYAWMSIQISLVNGRIVEAEAMLNAPDVKTKLDRVHYLESQISELKPKATVLRKVHDSESSWIEIMRQVGASVPANVWVTQLNSRFVDRGQQINLQGSALSQKYIGAYMLALQEADWFGPLQLVQADTNSNKGPEKVDFEIIIPLKEAIGLDLLKPKGSAADSAPAGDSASQGGEM
jgi:Tfp pilus assembly protein PilN